MRKIDHTEAPDYREIDSLEVEPTLDRRRIDVHDAGVDPGEWGNRDLTVFRLRLIWENRRLLARTTLGAILFFSVIALIIPNRYESVARLMPPDNESGSGLALAAAALSMGPSGLGGIASEFLGQKSSSDLVAGVLRSRTVEDRLIQNFNLKKVYGDHPIEALRKDLENRTEIGIDRKSQIVTVAVSDRSGARATAMAQTYIEELNRTLADVSTSAARRERIFLEGRLQKVSQDLESSERDFSQFASKNGTIDIKEQGKAMVTAAATLEGELIAARSELEGLRQIYTNNNVRVRSLEARIGELEKQLAKVGGGSTSPDTTGNSISEGNASVSSSDQQPSLYPSIRQLPLLGVPYADLYRKTRIQEAVFETLTQKYELAKVQEAKETPAIKVLDAPSVPERKSFPPRTLIVLLGGMMSFVGALVWIFARDRWEKSDGADPGKILAVEIFERVKRVVPGQSQSGRGTPNGA